MAVLHGRRRADPALAGALAHLARWQALRLRQTYADLAAQPRYRPVVDFFQNDLYGGGDFEARDRDLERIVPVMARMLPEKVIATVAQAAELNVLALELDAALLAHLPRMDGPIVVTDYCIAYRAMARRPDRERQIRLLCEVGEALDVHVRRPFLKSALMVMRGPAHVAGFDSLHQFLERGLAAFRGMQGTAELVAAIGRRERTLMERMLAGETAPFPDPMVGPGSGARP